MTGICHDPNSGGVLTLQETIDNHYAASEGDNYEKYVGISTSSEHGYTNHSYPILTANDEVLTVSYFDSYDFSPEYFRDEYYDYTSFGNTQSTRNRGRKTGGKIKILDNTNTWLYNAIFYNDRGQIIQTYSHNQFPNNNSCDELTFQYDFTGKVVNSKQVQTGMVDGVSHSYVIDTRFIYDHAGRLLSEYQSINNQAEVLVKQLQYNELGQVIEKNLHSIDQGNSFLQSVDYKYNIRGWLTHINQANLSNYMHFIPTDDNLAEIEVVDALEINNVGIKITHIEGRKPGNSRLEIAITDNKKVELKKVELASVRDVQGEETTFYTVYQSVQNDSMAFYTLRILDGEEFNIDFANLRIDESSSMLDIVLQIEEFAQDQLPEQDVDDLDQVSELSLFVMMHVLNSMGISYINEDNDDLFGMDLLYQQGFISLSGDEQLNGIISGIKWQIDGNNPGIRGYGFEYDDLYQLTNANYAKQGQAFIWHDEVDRYSVNNIDYDLNGNIEILQRNGVIGYEGGQYLYGMMDDLDYDYDGNQLISVDDIIPDPTFTGNDFRDNGYVNPDDEYIYDANGNMITDANKGITVTYNHINLPEEIDFGNGNKIKYLYTANGAKIKKTVETNSSISSTVHYAGNFVYNGNQLEHIVSSEGRVIKDGTTFEYQYFLRDHLGNVRVVFGEDEDGNAEILQEDHYYPFGLTYMGDLNYNYGTQENKYLYQGKELQDDHNLQWHDFGARMYDAQLGRWHCPDPLLQFNSPYLAMGNNPVSGVDPSGMWVDRIRGMASRGKALYDYMNFMRGKGYRWDGETRTWGQSMAVPLVNHNLLSGGYTEMMMSGKSWQSNMRVMAQANRAIKWHALKKELQEKLRQAILSGNQEAIAAEMDAALIGNEWIAEMTALLEEAGSQGLNFVSGEGDGNEETGNVVKGFTIDFAVCFGLEGMNNGFSFSFLTDGDDYGITFTQLRNGEGYEVTLIGLSGTYMEKMDGSDMTIEDSYGPGQTWSGGFLPFSLSVSGNNYAPDPSTYIIISPGGSIGAPGAAAHYETNTWGITLKDILNFFEDL